MNGIAPSKAQAGRTSAPLFHAPSYPNIPRSAKSLSFFLLQFDPQRRHPERIGADAEKRGSKMQNGENSTLELCVNGTLQGNNLVTDLRDNGSRNFQVAEVGDMASEVKRLNALHRQIEGLAIQGTRLAIQAGIELRTLKARVNGKQSRSWQKWFAKANFNFELKTAQNYMRLSEFSEVKRQIAELGLSQAYCAAGVLKEQGRVLDEPSLRELLGISDTDVSTALAKAPRLRKPSVQIDGDTARITPTAPDVAAIIAALTSDIEALKPFLAQGQSFVLEIKRGE